MNVKDIVALAHAGYNVEQINAIISAMSNQPVQMQQPVQQMQQPVQQMQQPVQQMQQPMQQMQQPMQQMQQMQQPMQQMQQPMQQPMQQMQQPMQQMQHNDPVLEQLRMLTGAVIQNNINGSSQPQQRNAEDIVASIINPKQEVTTNA